MVLFVPAAVEGMLGRRVVVSFIAANVNDKLLQQRELSFTERECL